MAFKVPYGGPGGLPTVLELGYLRHCRGSGVVEKNCTKIYLKGMCLKSHLVLEKYTLTYLTLAFYL